MKKISEGSIIRAAARCNVPTDNPEFRKALRSVRLRDERFWDAMANSGQIADNIPESVAIAIVFLDG